MAKNKIQTIKAWLFAEIKKGTFGKNTPLPGDLELMARFGVSRGTVRAAFSEMQHQGLVTRKRGLGTFLSKRGERRSGVLGLFFPEIDTCEYYHDVATELMSYAKRFGYDVKVCKFDSRHGKNALAALRHEARALATAPVEGVIFRPLISEKQVAVNREIVRVFAHAETPVVLFDADIEMRPRRSTCDLVAVNNVDAGRRVAEHLIERGRKRMAVLMVDCVAGHNENLNSRFFGVAGECVLHGLYDGVRPVEISPDDENGLKRLFRSRWRPDAFVCASDEIAVRLLKSLKALKVRVPQDVAIVGFDDVACAQQAVPALTTVRQPSRLIAQTLFKTLMFRIRYPDAPSQEIYLESPLVCRETT